MHCNVKQNPFSFLLLCSLKMTIVEIRLRDNDDGDDAHCLVPDVIMSVMV